MKILIINGSPKGENSVTYHTCLYMEKKYPEHEYDVIHAGQRIAGIQKKFDEVIPQLKQADMIVFSYPVYTFLVPSQLHRFIELMKEVDLKDKYVIQISTSKHFYDVTAHEFIKENCLDMGMKYLGGLSADMGDLTSESGRKEADDFFSTIFFKMEQGIYETGSFVPYVEDRHTYFKEVSGPKDTTKKVVIIADIKDEKDILRDKIAYFQSIFPYETKVINLNEMTIHGGCLGCMNCATDGKCIYKDHFDEFLRNEIQQMDGTIYAYTIKDHSMGYKMKLYDDRQFCNGHRTVTMGKPVGYIINGDLTNEHNLKMVMEARASAGGNYLAGIGANEADIRELSLMMGYVLEHRIQAQKTFYGVGGLKIFRDLIYQMQGIMKADHAFYKEHGMYDFPQKDKATIIGMKALGLLMSNPKIKATISSKMSEGMVMGHKKVIDEMK